MSRLTDVTSAGSTLRLFGYGASGQVISDTRSNDIVTSIFDYGLNARGRMISVSEEGALAASYTYDMSEQRIVKAVAGEAAIHYHYDGEGRLIAETDAATGTTLREYIWLGLTPIASFGSSYDPEDPVNDNCNPVFREGLAQRLLDRQDRLALVQECLLTVSGTLDDRTAREATVAARKVELETILAGVPETNVIRIDALTARIANLEERLTTLAAAIERLGTRIIDLTARETRLIEAVARIAARIERLNTICDDPTNPPPDNMNGPDTGNNVITLSFLHSDHLGRPKFATRADGSVSWDGGITTPFGVQITALAAQTQALMFPGQYEDVETTGAGVTLSHNWHRTYDPTLGRYLQADPIGLAGGLNRYAYVGGNPVGYVDPTGEKFFPPLQNYGASLNAALDQAYANHMMRNLNMTDWVCNESEIDLLKWKPLSAVQNAFHINSTGWPYRDWQNVKYVDRKTGKQELIFDGRGRLVTNSLNGPSYNYIGPEDVLGHTVLDVVPWLFLGNGPTFAPDCTCMESE